MNDTLRNYVRLAVIGLALVATGATSGHFAGKWLFPCPQPLPPTPAPKIPLAIPATISADYPNVVPVTAEGEATGVQWHVCDDGGCLKVAHEDSCCIKLVTLKPGRADLFAYGVYQGRAVLARSRLTIGQPGPTPPVPPGPGPVPPTPPDPPPPAPIPEAGFRVLMVYETKTAGTLPSGQRLALFGKQVRDYLNARCVTGPDGKTKEYRIYDQDISLVGESKLWQDAMKRPRKSAPWVVVSNGKEGFEGPLPENLDDTLKILKKYGGD